MDLPSLTPDDISKIKRFGEIAWAMMPERIKKAAHGLNDKGWNQVRWIRKATLYIEALYPRVASTRLLGHDKLIRIADIFTDVYLYDTPLASQLRGLKSLDAEALRAKRLQDEQLRRPAADILKQSRIYLVGKPGAGKTTLLRYLVLQSIANQAETTPIYIQLKDVVENTSSVESVDLWRSIIDQFKICKLPAVDVFVQDIFESGKVALLLDGLDEVTALNGIRQTLITQTQQISTRFPDIKIILTCRTGAEDFTFERFAVAQIADFSPEQQVYFVKRWYSADPRTLNSFLAQWTEPKCAGLRDLASTPLLLALLCISFDETREFPLRRGDLYKEATEALLRKWSTSRGITRDNPFKNFTASRKEQLLAHMAFGLFRKRRFIFTHQDAAEYINSFLLTLPKNESLGAYDPIDVIRHIEAAHGLLVHETSDFLAFSHLTIHEYFTARYLIDSSNEKVLQRELTFETMSNTQWREVILLAAGLLSSADYLLLLMRRVLCTRLAGEVWIRRTLETLKQKNSEPTRVWGAHVVEARFDPKHAEQVSGISLPQFRVLLNGKLSAIVIALTESGAGAQTIESAETLRRNIAQRDIKHAYISLCEGPRTRRDLFFEVLYLEELFSATLSIARVSDRVTLERSLFDYQH